MADHLRGLHPGLVVELVEIKTQGDRDRNTPLAAMAGSGTGLFTKEIQRAIVDGSVDVAVHSLKDLPTQGPAGLVLAAVPQREDVADALIAPQRRTLDALPSARRSAPARRGDGRSSSFAGRTWRSGRCGATSRPGSTRRSTGGSMRWSWPGQGSIGWAWTGT